MDGVFLITGSNRGDRVQLMKKAAGLIAKETGKIIRSSSFYETEPWGFIDPVSFLNQVIEIRTDLRPPDLLVALHSIEDRLGRSRTEHGYGPRTMDIDILLYGDLVISFPGLQIPHPLMAERRFVLEPLAEIAPGFVHPVFRITMREMLTDCRDKNKVVKMPEMP